MGFIKQQYEMSFCFFKERLMKICIGAGIGFFAVCILCYFLLKSNPQIAKQMIQYFMDSVQSSGVVNEHNQISVFMLILNNIRASFVSVALGIIPFLFLPLFSLLLNAAIIGALFAIISIGGGSFVTVFAGLIPHGIFEIPALIIAMSLGIYLCKELVMKFMEKRKNERIGTVFKDIARFFICTVIPLMLIAGFIETYITPLIMSLF